MVKCWWEREAALREVLEWEAGLQAAARAYRASFQPQ